VFAHFRAVAHIWLAGGVNELEGASM